MRPWGRKKRARQAVVDSYRKRLMTEAQSWQPGDRTTFLMFTATDDWLGPRYLGVEMCDDVTRILADRGISRAEVKAGPLRERPVDQQEET